MRRIPNRNHLLGFAFTALIFASSHAFAQVAVEPGLRLYFIPFSIMDYSGVPVTQEDLKKQRPLLFTKDHPFIAELYGILTASAFSRYDQIPTENPTQPQEADVSKRQQGYEDCRLITDFGLNKGVFVVFKGGIIKALKDNTTFILSSQEQSHLQERILSFRGVVDTNLLKEYSE